MSKVHIVGAGASGLLSAYWLTQAGHQCHIYEQSSAVGGLINTHQLSIGPVETAANAFLANAALEALCKNIGIELLPTKASAKNRYIGTPTGIKKWPLSITDSFVLLAKGSLLLLQKTKPQAGESVKDYFSRVLSPAIAKKLIEPGLGGVFLASADQLSAQLLYQQMFYSKALPKAELKGSCSFKVGMGGFLQKLASYLTEKGCQIHINHHISEIESFAQQPVVFATSIAATAKLLKHKDVELSQALLKVPLLDVTTATLFSRNQLMDGFGCLFQHDLHPTIRGVLQNDAIFESRVHRPGLHSSTWILSQACEMEDAELLQAISLFAKSKALDLGVVEEFSVTHWKRALPLHGHQLFQAQKILHSRNFKNTFLIGNYTEGIGLSSIIKQALKLSERIQ